MATPPEKSVKENFGKDILSFSNLWKNLCKPRIFFFECLIEFSEASDPTEKLLINFL